MRYSLEKRKEVIYSKPIDLDVQSYCNQIGISCSTYYKWARWLKDSKSDCVSVSPIDITNLLSSHDNNVIDLELSNVVIHTNSSYDEKFLLRLLNTLKKL